MTGDELLRQLEEEQGLRRIEEEAGRRRATSVPPAWAQLPLGDPEVIARRLSSILKHPSMGDEG